MRRVSPCRSGPWLSCLLACIALLGNSTAADGGHPARFLAPSAPPEILSDPLPRSASLGSQATLTVVARGEGTLTYQWRKDGADLVDGPGVSGSATDALILDGIQFADAGEYGVVVTNASGSVTSADASLSVRMIRGVPYLAVARLYGDPLTSLSIAGQPSDQTSYAGCCAVFHVDASGSPRDYRWRKDGVDLVDGGNVGGAASPTLTIQGASLSDEGSYSVRISNALGEVKSNDAMLTIAEAPPCQVASCDAVLGCRLSAAPDGAACTDGDACTTGDACHGGACAGFPGTPAEVGGVRLDGSGGDATIHWSPASNATSWSVLRGATSALPVGSGGGEEMCLATGLPEETLAWADPSIPFTGAAYWYLVRGDNACGQGTYGFEGSHGAPGAARTSTTCP